MQIANAMAVLETSGYRFTASGDTVKVRTPAKKHPEADRLLAILRENKPAVLAALQGGLTPVPPNEGDAYQVAFDGGDEGQRTRWRVAVREGLIVLDGPVRFRRKDNTVRIAFHAATPLDWLQEDITGTCKERFNAVLGRIEKGETWLKANADDPRYEEHYTRFTALFDELRELYSAIGESLEDPFTGYQEAIA